MNLRHERIGVMAIDYLKHNNRAARSIQLTGKYVWTTPKSIKPIIIHTTTVKVEMMMINGTKYPLNRSASCWMGAYKNKTPRPWEITIYKEINRKHRKELGFFAPSLTLSSIKPAESMELLEWFPKWGSWDDTVF